MYTPLRVITDNTLLNSLIKIDDLINFCVKNNISSCGICDYNLFGSIEFIYSAQKNNIKPIVGLTIKYNNCEILLYAINYNGYKNLLKINTIICEREITIDELKKYSEDILLIIPYKYREIGNKVSFYKYVYYGYENELELRNLLLTKDNVLYINTIRALNKSDLKYMKYLDLIKEVDVNNYENDYYHIDNISKFDESKIEEIVNLINLDMPKNKRYIPRYSLEDSYKLLSSLCIKGLKKRLNNVYKKEYIDRLKYELNVINKMGFTDYFLIVYDYVLYAKKNNILVGPGRGSAAGSLVSYAIGITDIDPIKYNLLFERFLNYERVTMPDIDIDFENNKRDLVINYVKGKYGVNNVSGGMTYTTLKTRLVIREVGKILKIDERLLNKFIKELNKDLGLKDNLKNDKVKEYLQNYSELKTLYDISMHLEGIKKNISTHAAGIVIGDRCLDEIIPMYKNNEVYLAGVDLSFLENIGLLKMDFLALKNLTTIANIIKYIPNFKLQNIILDDKLTYELFCNGDTSGIFQFETYSFKAILPKFKPHNFNELVALIALNRPGPSGELETYIKRKNKIEKISYYHDSLKSILEETYGVIIYQEQVISILVKMAHFSYAEADNVRRAMSKKKEDIIKKMQQKFIAGSIKNGYSEELSVNIYNQILKFASYGFNKAHSVSYAIISYWMAYLKVHYNTLFTIELLNNSLGSTNLVKEYINNLKKDNTIKSVSINHSNTYFVIDNKVIYLPFKLIKNLKGELINNIIEERNKNGLFKDVFDFFKRTIKFISKNDYLMLINGKALEEFNLNVKELTINLDTLMNYGNLYAEIGEYALIPELKRDNEYDIDTLRVNEINSYGFYITNHPASKINDKNIVKLRNIKNYEFKNIVCYVMIENVIRIKTKKGEDMAFINASDETGSNDFTVFPNKFYLLQNIVKENIVRIYGSVSKRYDKLNIIVNNLKKEE